MKMLGMAVLAAAGAAAAFGGEAAAKPFAMSKETRLKMAQLHRRIDGGIVPKVGTGKGYVAIVNASGYDNAVCAAVGAALSREHRLYVSNFVGTAASPSPAAMVVLTSAEGPMLTVNPDTRIATVSLAALKPGADEETLKERVKKSLKRAFGHAIGAGVSGSGTNLMKPVRSLAELDGLDSRAPLDVENALIQNAELGLCIYTPITYREALKQGCAPAPVTKEQKRLWNEFANPEKRWDADFGKDGKQDGKAK